MSVGNKLSFSILSCTFRFYVPLCPRFLSLLKFFVTSCYCLVGCPVHLVLIFIDNQSLCISRKDYSKTNTTTLCSSILMNDSLPPSLPLPPSLLYCHFLSFRSYERKKNNCHVFKNCFIYIHRYITD